ncbi:MAG: Abi family protein [Stenotrophomonas sp.]|uniref:hypothetical protein n=1 Tax=Stenotrophomonas sp. TaxID=69392 RepID=UPI002FC8932A
MRRYLAWAGHCSDRGAALYGINLQLCESLYVPLQTLEVSLRNRIHQVLLTAHGPCWFDTERRVLRISRQHEQVGAATADLRRQGRAITPGGIISHLTFGFWTMMFNKEHEVLWQQVLHRISADPARRGLQRKQFSTPLVRIRHLRNRIAHHESILHWPLRQHHADMMQLMEWITPEAAAWCRQHDRFPSLLARYSGQLPGIAG